MSVGAFTAATDTGRKRRRNEDAYVVAPPLFAVADGMGGAQAGEVASKLAAAALVGHRSRLAVGHRAGDVALPGGEPARVRALGHRPGRLRDGDDDDGRARRGQRRS